MEDPVGSGRLLYANARWIDEYCARTGGPGRALNPRLSGTILPTPEVKFFLERGEAPTDLHSEIAFMNARLDEDRSIVFERPTDADRDVSFVREACRAALARIPPDPAHGETGKDIVALDWARDYGRDEGEGWPRSTIQGDPAWIAGYG